MTFVVAEVIKADTFKVSPEWIWDFQEGNTVKMKGYKTPAKSRPDHEDARKKSEELLLGKEIELTDAIKLTDEGQLLCDVYFHGKNLADYFSQRP